MKQNLLLSICFICTLTINAQWIEQESGVTEDLIGICFVDEDYGWAMSRNGLIIFTSNGGNTWEEQYQHPGTVEFEKMKFTDRETGYIVGKEGFILSTKNGGISWEQQTSNTTFPIFDLTFINDSCGWLVASDIYENKKSSLVISTTDGGNNWNTIFEDTSGLAYLFSSVDFHDDQNGWIAGRLHQDNYDPSRIIRTRDGGNTWELLCEINRPILKLSAIEEETVYASGSGFYLIESSEYDTLFSGLISNFCIPNNNSIACLYTDDNSKDILIISDDLGFTWEYFEPPGDKTLWGLSALDNNTFGLAGNDGVILKYHREAVGVAKDNLPAGFSLSQNYPNPFNPTTIIEFTLPETSNVKLEIYNPLGEKVSELINNKMSAGNHSVEFNINNLPSGIYFYTLKTKNYLITKKMVSLK